MTQPTFSYVSQCETKTPIQLTIPKNYRPMKETSKKLYNDDLSSITIRLF